jgi:hypothetical protein
MNVSQIVVDLLLTIVNANPPISYVGLEKVSADLGYKKSQYNICLTQFKHENFIRTKRVQGKGVKFEDVCVLTKNGTEYLVTCVDTNEYKKSKANI